MNPVETGKSHRITLFFLFINKIQPMRLGIFKRVWVIIFALSSIQSLAQDDVRFRQIAREDGLSDNSIFSITQDSKGFLWFGSRMGLNRYDGYRIKKYFHEDKNPSSLISNDVISLFFDDATESIWIGTHDGLSNFSPSQNKFINYFKEDHTSVFNIIRSKNGSLMVASDKGLFVHEGDSVFRKLPVPLSEHTSVTNIFEDNRGLVWFSIDEELFLINNDNDFSYSNVSKLYPELRALDGLKISALFEDQKGIFWFGTEYDGVFLWDREKMSLVNYRNDANDTQSLSSNGVRAIIQGINGGIWIGTAVGINIYQPNSNDFKRILNEGSNPGGLSNNSIRSMHVDDKGGIWIGTYYRGINYTDETFSRFNISYLHSGSSSDDRNLVSALSSDHQGNVLVGTEGKGIGMWNSTNSEFNFLDLGDELRNANVKKIYPWGESVWIGTYRQGLIQLDNNLRVQQSFVNDLEDTSSITNNNVYDILASGEYLWLATHGGGLVRMELLSNIFETFVEDPANKNSILSNNVKIVKKGANRDLYIGTSEGVSVSKSHFENGHFETLLENVDVYSMETFEPDVLWVGTLLQGLYKIDQANDTIINYSINEGLKGNTVYVILPDGEDLWLSTNTGVVKFNTVTKQFFNYGFDSELRKIEFSRNVGYVHNEELFLMGSNSGLVFFEPSKIVMNEYIPPLIISEISILGAESNLYVDKMKQINLDYKNANLKIEFASLDYTGPANNKYAYRMKGIDSDWIYTVGQSEATYTFQKEGDYEFEFKGSNSDGVWSPEVSSLSINVSPPWFRSWWATVLYVLFFGGIFYLLFRLIRLRNNYHIEHLAKEEQERSHELKIRFFTNITHELRTPLTLMLGPLHSIIQSEDLGGTIKNKLEGVQKNVVRLSHLVNQLLDFRKLETDHMKLTVNEGDIIEFLKEIYFAFKEETQKRNIDFIFETHKEAIKCWYDADKLEKVFFNLLSNALKFTPDFGTIKVLVEDGDEFLSIKITDSGSGIEESLRDQIFERFYERNSLNYSNPNGIGIGLALTKQLVELHQGQIFVNNEECKGSVFVVQLKKGFSHFTQNDLYKVSEVQSEPRLPENTPVNIQENETSRKLELLIVEDDLEIRDYIQSLFGSEYKISLAANGLKGFEIACNKIPDIIISDVMMPEMDGITMCGKLKTTIETSHIPIILLTARSATAFRIGGLETGADDYITKPFRPEELILKTKNILSARNAYLEKLARTHDFEPKRLAITSTDEKFLSKLLEIAEKNVENSDISVEQVADHLNVSRALLFTKIKALTGKTPKGFINDFRLKRAAQLLQDTDLNISQVAYKSGFKDYRYFTKVFKKQYQMSPKEFAKKS